MRKLVFILLSLMLTTESSANCFKIMAGVNFSRYSGSLVGEEAWKFRMGFEVGAGYEIAFGSHLALEIDGLVIQKGSKKEFIEDGRYYYTIYYKLDEFIVPLLCKIRLKADSSPYIFAGAELSFVFSHKAKIGEGVEVYVLRHHEEPPTTKKFYYGLVFGCGYEWEFKSVFPFVEIRFNLFPPNILESGTLLYKPRAILFLIGLKLYVS